MRVFKKKKLKEKKVRYLEYKIRGYQSWEKIVRYLECELNSLFDIFVFSPFIRPLFFKVRILDSELFFSQIWVPPDFST
jgi:hypothetical protein